MKTNYTLFLFSIGLLLGACEPKAPEDTSSEVDVEETADTLYYEYTTFSKAYGECKTDTSAYCTRINLTYPKFKSERYAEQSDRMNSIIQSQVLNQVYPDTVKGKGMEMFANQFISDYKEIREAFGETIGWYAKMNSKVLRNDTIVVTIELTTDMYTGGAHGNISLQYININPQSGEPIALNSLFQPGYDKKLNEIVEQKFREKHGISPDRDLSDEGFQFQNNKYYNEDNFALLTSGIKFYFNNYEIAPYSKGPSEIIVRYDDLKDIMKHSELSAFAKGE